MIFIDLINSALTGTLIFLFSSNIVFSYALAFLIQNLLILFLHSTKYGELLMRSLEGARPLYTSQLINRLQPLMDEVKMTCENAYIEKLKDDIRNLNLYVIDTLEINAFAISDTSIAITRGAVNTFSDSAIKGLIAHEIGHWDNGDTLINIQINVGNIIYFLVVKVISSLFERATDKLGQTKKGVMYHLINSLGFIFHFLRFIQEGIFKLLFIYYRRKQELKADEYAYDMGYGEELIEALYIFDELSSNDR